MTAHLVTFSDEIMRRSADLCVDSAMQHGVDGITWAFAATIADKANGRGLGFWAWKPRIILDLLTDATGGLAHPDEGDILIYSDAGVEFVDNVNYVIDRMDQDIWLFGNQYEHAHWCKRDIVEAVWPLSIDDWRKAWWAKNDEERRAQNPDHVVWERFGKQVQASVIFFRVNDKTRAFVKEWLDWCLFEGGRLIDDSPSRSPNHPEFQENRHDQAILTTIAYRDGYKLHYWPASYNDGAFEYPRGDYPDDGYPMLFDHHRKRNHEWGQVA
jgi:hypothetical protein